MARARLVSFPSALAFAVALFPCSYFYFVAVHQGDDLPLISSFFLLLAAWPWWLARCIGLASEHASYLTVGVVVFAGWYLALLSPFDRAMSERS